MANRISVVIHAYNSEKDIEDCFVSAQLLTNSIILIDTGSEDATKILAKKLGAIVYTHPYTLYVEPSRNFGIGKTAADWVFILDTDERMTPELASEIKQTIESTENSFFNVPRKNIFARTKWLRHGGWWPDYQIRLINKNQFVDWPKEIHSTPQIKGNQGFLANPLDHYFHGDIHAMVEKTLTFEDMESTLLYAAHKQATTATFFRKFIAEFYRRIIKDFGFLDGPIGIIEGAYQAFSKTITYLYLYEKNHAKHNEKSRVL